MSGSTRPSRPRRIVISAVVLAAGAAAVLFWRNAGTTALHLSVAEELRECRVDASIPRRRPIVPDVVMKPLRRIVPAVGNGPLGGSRVTDVVFWTNSDGARAVDALCRLEHVPIIALYLDGPSDVLTVEELGRLTEALEPEVLYLESLVLPRTAIPALNSPGLRWLHVHRTQFSNPAIASLPASLEYLDATRTRINDDGLPMFVPMTNLKKLILRRTPTSEVAIEKLRKQMPWCVIEWQKL